MEEKNRQEPDLSEFDLQLPQEEPVVGYRRPENNKKKKGKSKTFGLLALCLSLIGFVLILAVGLYGAVTLVKGSLSASILTAATVVVWACIILGAAALLLSFATLFLRKQRKTAAIVSIFLSLILLAMCVGAAFAYNYVFGSLQQDAQLEELSHEDLNVVQKDESGEIIRENQPLSGTVSQEEIRQKTQSQEVEWEYLADEDLPDKVKELVYGPKPSKSGYLLEGSEQISTFVLYGTDAVGSSDSVILVAVDRAHKKVKMISIPRDSYVTIPEWGSHAKLTYAYAFGGVQMAISTLNYNYFLDVTDYISVNMEQLADIVDLVGGVDVYLDWSEVSYLRGEQRQLNYGKCRLYGEAALTYSRIRQSNANDNEINRQGRQREVLLSIMESVRQMPPTEFPAFIRACLGMCTTSLQAKELLDIALEVAQNDYSIEAYSLIEKVEYWGGHLGAERYFYCVYDLNKASDIIYRIIYEDLYISCYTDEELAPPTSTEQTASP